MIGRDPESAVDARSAGVHRSPRRALRAAFQLLGFLIGLGLLAWCASVALRPENREQLRKLSDANPWEVGALAVLSAMSLVVNATAFWAVIRPVQRVAYSSVLAVNCIATALASLPFKLSVVSRFVIHHRRDGVPLLTITTWMGNSLVIMLATLTPILVASAWRGRIDATWCAVSLLGVIAACILVIGSARLLARGPVWRAVERWTAGPDAEARGPLRRRAARLQLLPRAAEGLRMLSSPSGVGGGAALRCADVAIQAGRFLVAARISGQTISPDDAVIAASAYFLVGVLSPTGTLGFREAAVFGILRAESFSIVVLTVTAMDTMVVLACATVSWISLKVSEREKSPGRV